jgi:hypothetical protein
MRKRGSVKKTITCVAGILIYTLAASINLAQAQDSKGANVNSRSQTRNRQFQCTNLLALARPQRRAGFTLMPAINNAAATGPAFIVTPTASVPNQQVFGVGTGGRLTKWTGFTTNTSVIGDSNIFEDKFGKVGIGTTAPTSLFTVQGMIETFGGIKFGDGTTQTTSTAGALFGVMHEANLQGNGTGASPLGVVVPLALSGSVADPNAVITATNTSTIGGMGIRGIGGSGAGLTLGVPIGVMGESNTGIGVFGSSNSSPGVFGSSDTGVGVSGDSLNGLGVVGRGRVGVTGVGQKGNSNTVGGVGVEGAGGSGIIGGAGMRALGGTSTGAGEAGGDGIYAQAGFTANGVSGGVAGRFVGDVSVNGNLTKTTGTFKIDHPLDPENRYLYHSFVESPDMMNIYNGNITTDENGDAVVEMPDYFDALNKDFRYQLTVIGTFAQAIIAREMKGNRFVIKTNAASVKVSWMVTGVRHDAYADRHRIKVEEDKPERERGFYLHPEVFNQPEEKSIEWARNPEMMQKLKQQRLEAEEKVKKQQQR